MRLLVIGGIVVVLLAAGVRAVTWYQKDGQYSSRAASELSSQQAEIEECKGRLATLHAAWESYRKANGGASPPSVESMVPKHLKDPKLLFCPTAERWKGKAIMAQGNIKVGDKEYPVTYAFKWMVPGYDRFLGSRGENSVLVVCETHREGVYRAAYQKPPQLGTFDPSGRGSMADSVNKAPILALRRSGAVDVIGAEELD
ncbi:MAG: hypothetical protein ACK47B_14730 [Armatimonadota bacterium]